MKIKARGILNNQYFSVIYDNGKLICPEEFRDIVEERFHTFSPWRVQDDRLLKKVFIEPDPNFTYDKEEARVYGCMKYGIFDVPFYFLRIE